ncbi:MAG: hypothetical protein RL757_998 [Bacteroidota bacterium]|jgi:D-alanine-D-alanine ligase
MSDKKKKNIALLAGGYSGEYVVSVKSAAVVEGHLDTTKFNTYKIVVTTEGWTHEADGKRYEINKNDFSLTINRRKVRFDAVLMMIHGTPGEDGKLQGYFDMLNIPYTTCDAATSAITFNKRYTVATAAFGGVNVAKSELLFKQDYRKTDIQKLRHLNMPVFVKPNNGGSSIGMSKVNRFEDLEVAIEKAFGEDTQVLVEEFIKGREFTVGVFKTKGEIMVLPICEVVTKKEFFDYEAKYEGKSEELIPAPIDETQANILRSEARRIYEMFNCKGITRTDFIWNEADQKPYMLEINTVPGQSQASIVPQMVRAMGWTMTEFYTRLVEEVI